MPFFLLHRPLPLPFRLTIPPHLLLLVIHPLLPLPILLIQQTLLSPPAAPRAGAAPDTAHRGRAQPHGCHRLFGLRLAAALDRLTVAHALQQQIEDRR
jgi:hypothetical protein